MTHPKGSEIRSYLLRQHLVLISTRGEWRALARSTDDPMTIDVLRLLRLPLSGDAGC